MKLTTACAMVCGLTAFGLNPAAAQVISGTSASDGITVFGTGQMMAQPNLVEIDLSVSGKAELTGDALVKYRDAKKRVEEALARLNLKDLSTEELALSISAGSPLEQQQRAMNGIPQTAVKNQIEVSSVLRVSLKGIRDMSADELLKTVGRLLDVAQDSGVTIGPSAAELMQAMRYGNYNQSTNIPVRFVVADLVELREKAYELAVADARGRGSRLAKLNAVNLGSALSVQEISVSGDQPSTQYVNPNVSPRVVESAHGPSVGSASISGIPVQVKLLVRYSIESLDPATAQK